MIQKELSEESAAGASGAVRQMSEGAYYAKTVFDRHGIAMSERSKLVERILGLAYSAAHRRVKGQSPWTVEDLGVLARHFGETLDKVFIAAAKSRAHSATLIAGDLRLKCQLWLGREVSGAREGELVAVKDGARWAVVSTIEGRDGPFFDVDQLLLETNAVSGSRVAVLDDQESITEPLCLFLTRAGFKADAYHSIRTLKASLSTLSYDAYVLDWVIGDETVRDLVEWLRESDPDVPIAILTGKANEPGDVVTDIANMVARYDNLSYHTKPLDPHIIPATLSRALTTRGRR